MTDAAANVGLQGSRAIIVLGMHRSGTSATAGILDCLGFEMGTNLIAAEADSNEKGFWENYDVNNFNERLLKHLGSSWYDLLALSPDWCARAQVSGFGAELEKLLLKNFSGYQRWAVKDPRLCRLLPLMRNALERLKVTYACLVVIRNPTEVAMSLARRNGFDEEYSQLLWLRHVLDAELHTRGLSRSFVFFDRLLCDWKNELLRAADEMAVDLAMVDSEAANRIENHLDPDLRHFSQELIKPDVRDPDVFSAVYESFLRGDLRELDSARDYLETVIQANNSWIRHINCVQAKMNEEILLLRKEAIGIRQKLRRVRSMAVSERVSKLFRHWGQARNEPGRKT